MRPDLDFRSLRSQVEAATYLPDFGDLWRRARRVRLRDRMAVLGALFGTLAVFLPVVIATMVGKPVYNPSPVGPDVTVTDTPSPSPSASGAPADAARLGPRVQVRAVAGALPDGVLAAVDVCRDGDDAGSPSNRRCNLQVVPLATKKAGGHPQLAANLLRDHATERLDNVRMVRLTSSSVLLSGVLGAHPRANLRVGPSGAVAVESPTALLPLRPGDRAVQLADDGEIFGARESDATLSLLGSQPAVDRRTVDPSIAPDHGWWATGVDPTSGAPAVAVSRDQGHSWTVRALPGPAGSPGAVAPVGEIGVPTLATADGKTVHAYVRYDTGIRQYRSGDGGASWTEVSRRIVLPGTLDPTSLAGRDFGAVARHDGSVLLWIQDVDSPIFLNSDDGETFSSAVGPGGDVVAVGGGFVSLGERPEVSSDGVAWNAGALPDLLDP
jgi:hypothetical protein